MAPLAYLDEDLPFGHGRYLVEPLVTARLAQLARVRQGERVLVVAAGTGYGAAILAACGGLVTALEEDDALMAIALRVLPRAAPAVRLVNGRLAAGLPGDGPWDAIMIEGAVTAIPDVYATQLAPGGRLVTAMVPTGVSGGRIVLGRAGGRQAPASACARGRCSIATRRCCRACRQRRPSCFSPQTMNRMGGSWRLRLPLWQGCRLRLGDAADA